MAKFTDIFEDVTKQGTKIPTNLYLENGLYPIIDQGQSEIAGYTNQTEGLFSEIPAIIFGDHTRIIKYVDTPCFLGADGVKLLKAKDNNANYKYLYYALCHADIPNTGYNRHFKWLKEIDIPEYPVEEQNSIVAQLEKIDILIYLRKQQLSKLDELVKSRFIELFGNIDDCENKLELQDICIKITDGSHNPPAGIEKSANYMISSQNIHDNIIDYKDVRYLSDSDFVIENKRTAIEIGDVLLTIVGAIGRSAVVKDDLNITCQRSVCVIHPNRDKVNSIFLKYMLDNISDKIINEARGAAQKGIYLNQVKKLQIICPSFELQNAFAAFVEQTDKSKLAIQQSLEKLETLKKALMQKYFG